MSGSLEWKGLLAGLIVAAALHVPARAQTAAPAVGARAPAFTLNDLDGAPVSLAGELTQGAVVLIVGRGWPGYQCPFCTKQFADFRAHAAQFAAAGARVLWIYPGPSDDLVAHAKDFIAAKDVPANFRLLIDPGYTFTNAYRLRWDAPKETAYPATFIIDRGGIIRFARVSNEHGNRTAAADVLAALPAK